MLQGVQAATGKVPRSMFEVITDSTDEAEEAYARYESAIALEELREERRNAYR